MADNEECVANAFNLVNLTTFENIIKNPKTGTFSVATNEETPTVKARVDGLLEANKWIKNDNGDLYDPSRSRLYNGTCYLGGFNAICTSAVPDGVWRIQVYQAKIETQAAERCSMASATPQAVNNQGILGLIINTIKQLLPFTRSNSSSQPVSSTSSPSNNDGNKQADIPVYPSAKLVPNIGRPLANGWNRVYVLSGVHLQEVLKFYQNWMVRTGRSFQIRSPMGISGHSDSSNHGSVCSSVFVAFGSGGKIGQEAIHIDLEAITPYEDCLLSLANAERNGQATVVHNLNNLTPGGITGFTNVSNMINVGGNNTVIDIIYISKAERVNNGNQVPLPVNGVPNQKPLNPPSYPQNPPAPDDWYKLIPRVSIGYLLDNLGHTLGSLLPFGWGK